MKIAGEYTFDAPKQIVWDAIRDPDVLGKIMPGSEGIEEIGENEYQGGMKVKVGPVNGKFKADIKLTNIQTPDSYDIEVNGKGAPGVVKATGSLTLTETGDKTNLEYSGDAKIGGRIASVGQRLLDTSAKVIVRQSLDMLNEYINVKVAAQKAIQEGGTSEEITAAIAKADIPQFVPPSQAKLATDLAKNVAGELIPAKYRPALIGLAVVIVILILIAIF
ncbi:MAG: carbon monoxide dehydrogenase subunit G [Chloroflexi bacterium]|nr:carbon monoxide dehydrogenase subunit G [Chloroflexota bacterium]